MVKKLHHIIEVNPILKTVCNALSRYVIGTIVHNQQEFTNGQSTVINLPYLKDVDLVCSNLRIFFKKNQVYHRVLYWTFDIYNLYK